MSSPRYRITITDPQGRVLMNADLPVNVAARAWATIGRFDPPVTDPKLADQVRHHWSQGPVKFQKDADG